MRRFVLPLAIGLTAGCTAQAVTSLPPPQPTFTIGAAPSPAAATPRPTVKASHTPIPTRSPLPPPRRRVVVLDPGHDGGNGAHPQDINRQVPAGNGKTKACDTVGASTNAGYPESAFTFDVAGRVAALLRARGITVVFTRTTNSGVGPCVDRRAQIGNDAHADAAVSIHADGGPPAGRGFHVIWPAPSDHNGAVVEASHRLAQNLRDHFRDGAGEPTATHTASSGLAQRSDLAGLNLSTVPKVFIECANMRNAADASRISSPAWRQVAAKAITEGLLAYLR